MKDNLKQTHFQHSAFFFFFFEATAQQIIK